MVFVVPTAGNSCSFVLPRIHEVQGQMADGGFETLFSSAPENMSFCVISDRGTIPTAYVWCFITVRTLKLKHVVLLNDLDGERCA